MTITLAQLEGSLRVRLKHASELPAEVHIAASSPAPIARLLIGQTVERALWRIPRLYSVCAIAQGTAAVQACEQALGIEVCVQQKNARCVLVDIESAKEHLWRIVLDWPRLLGEADGAQPPPAAMSALLAAYQAALYADNEPHQVGGGRLRPDQAALTRLCGQLETVLADAVFGMPPAAWSALHSEAALIGWANDAATVAARLLRRIVRSGWAALGRSEVPDLPPVSAVALHARLAASDAEQFVGQPTWGGGCCETTPLTRNRRHPLIAELTARHGSGLLPRLAARLTELAALPRRVCDGAAALRDAPGAVGVNSAAASGVGLSQIEAARGRLIHRVAVANGRILAYQIVAPTAWNFHPCGAAAEALRQMLNTDPERLAEKAALLIEAIDPCVRYRLSVQRND